MVNHKILHFKKECISCGACAAICPEFWEMDEEGLAQLKGSEEKEDHWELKVNSEEERAVNQEAAAVCPVNIILLQEEDKIE